MAKHGYVPTKAELQAALLDIAALLYAGKYAPGESNWNTHKPKGWAACATLARHFKPSQGDAPNWAAAVYALVGLPIAPPNSVVNKQPYYTEKRDKEQPFERVNDDPFNYGSGLRVCGLPVSRSYTNQTTGHNHYVLR